MPMIGRAVWPPALRKTSAGGASERRTVPLPGVVGRRAFSGLPFLPRIRIATGEVPESRRSPAPEHWTPCHAISVPRQRSADIRVGAPDSGAFLPLKRPSATRLRPPKAAHFPLLVFAEGENEEGGRGEEIRERTRGPRISCLPDKGRLPSDASPSIASPRL